MSQTGGAAAIEMTGLVKRFGGVAALDGAALRVEPGTIHGLVGQNGAGKSTLIKLLGGIHRPDAGRIAVHGRALDGLTPRDAEAFGIHFIHQDRLLVPSFTVGEALFLGHEARLPGTPFLDRRAMERRAETLLRDYFGVTLARGALVGALTTAERQIVQITRALIQKPSVLVFDEPTAALVRREAEILFDLIRRLKAEGLTILYVSHYLGEIESLCDRVTVMRDGRDVAVLERREATADRLASLMTARDLGRIYPERRTTRGAPVLTVANLSRRASLSDVSFTLHRGEVLGLTGLVGSGVKDVVRTLFGLETAGAGTVAILGRDGRPASPAQAVSRSLALLPEDRRGHGVALGMSVRENATLASLQRFSRLGFLSRRREAAATDGLIARLGIKTDGRDAAVGTLSGGNQQKVALAKWLSRQSDVYILDEPTVGVDIGSKVEIYRLVAELAAGGAGVLVVSSDLAELVGITDRILVMVRGGIRRAFVSAQTSESEVLAAATASYGDLRHVG